jgi:hypothetical protein
MRAQAKTPTPTTSTPIPFKLLEEKIAERLRNAGIRSCEQWKELTPMARSSIWGVTRAVDAIVAAALERARP